MRPGARRGRVRIELAWPPERPWPWYLAGGMAIFWLLALLGFAASHGQPEVSLLTRAQWQALRVHRQTRQDAARLTRDLAQLQRVARAPYPDPVPTLLLAQRIYARQRRGAVASTLARQALMQAGETAVQLAYGAVEPRALADALQAAEAQLLLLQE